MIILDANILLYSHNSSASQNPSITTWLRKLFDRKETIGLPWVTIWAFLRIWTNPRIWPTPNSLAETFSILEYWFSQPGVAILNPGPRHRELLTHLVEQYQVAGPLMSDAVLAALAIENGATLASTDQDFSRFSGLSWINPLK